MGGVWGNASSHWLCVGREKVEEKTDVDSWAPVNGFTGCSGIWKEQYWKIRKKKVWKNSMGMGLWEQAQRVEIFTLPAANSLQGSLTQKSACHSSRQKVSAQKRCINWKKTDNGPCPQQTTVNKTVWAIERNENAPKFPFEVFFFKYTQPKKKIHKQRQKWDEKATSCDATILVLHHKTIRMWWGDFLNLGSINGPPHCKGDFVKLSGFLSFQTLSGLFYLLENLNLFSCKRHAGEKIQ